MCNSYTRLLWTSQVCFKLCKNMNTLLQKGRVAITLERLIHLRIEMVQITVGFKIRQIICGNASKSKKSAT